MVQFAMCEWNKTILEINEPQIIKKYYYKIINLIIIVGKYKHTYYTEKNEPKRNFDINTHCV